MTSRVSRMTIIAVTVGAAIFLFLGTCLQRATTEFFASPDETAVAFFARAWTMGEGFRIPYAPPGALSEIAGLRARSIVQDGDALVPVGFLGMPIIAGFFEKIGRGLSAFLAPILVLSSVYPFYQIVARRSRRLAFLASAVFLSFPTVILYANRGLFPNLPVVALAIWAVWLTAKIPDTKYQIPNAICAGFVISVALLIRPVEAIWVLPWIAWSFWGHGKRRTENGERKTASPFRSPFVVFRFPLAVALAAGMLVCLGGWIVARQTYGGTHGLFPIGYFVHDAPTSVAVEAVSSGGTGFRVGLPFGIHPRTLWMNVQTYFGSVFGLWIGLACLGVALDLRRRGGFLRGDLPVYGLIAWTVFALFLLYGQAAYADNINGGATIGNSFLRYMLPLAPIIAIGCALTLDRLFSLARGRGFVFGPIAACLLALFGVVTAFARDEEGVLRTQYELTRYAIIRAAAEERLPIAAVIFSERSDKIFVTGPFIAVSPIPDAETVARVHEAGIPAYLFTRTLEDDSTDPVVAIFGGARPVFMLQNETMYELGAQVMEDGQ